MRYYRWSMIFTVVAVGIGFYIGGLETALIVAILGVLETSLSFDNAVVNARVLQHWDHRWRRIFLTWGIWIAVFGMRVIFPLAIVSVATGLDPVFVTDMALNAPGQYALHLSAVHHQVAGFGGAFLFMVALHFFFEEKHVYWLEYVETKLTRLGQIEGVAAAITLVASLVVARFYTDPAHGTEFAFAAMWGVVTYVVAHGLGSMLGEDGESGGTVVKAGLAGFLYLEILDASFSFDGVIGAFVLTNYLPVIALGLGIGAFFVRSMTIHLVEAGTLAEYRYLEHGAFYAILALAVLMYASGLGLHLPEWLTGLLSVAFIGLALAHSTVVNRREERAEEEAERAERALERRSRCIYPCD